MGACIGCLEISQSFQCISIIEVTNGPAISGPKYHLPPTANPRLQYM